MRYENACTMIWLVHTCMTWRIRIHDMTPSYVRRDSCVGVTWLMRTYWSTYVRHDACLSMHICAMNVGISMQRHAAYICMHLYAVVCCIHMYAYLCLVRRDACLSMPWTTQVDEPRLHHVTYVNESRHTYRCVTSHTWVHMYVTHKDEWCEWVTSLM